MRELVIDAATAGAAERRIAGRAPPAAAPEGLTAEDKAQILDGQALQLRGVALRICRAATPRRSRRSTDALDQLIAVRGGRIAATIWLRAQILGELADIAEARGDQASAERQHRAAVALLEPTIRAPRLCSAPRAGSLAIYGRTGRTEEALSLYREIVAGNPESGAGVAVVAPHC